VTFYEIFSPYLQSSPIFWQWYLPENETCQATVPEAVRCFLESTDFGQCIRLTISLGGDCDTTSAMSGAIGEAFYGIPEWITQQQYGN